MVSTSTTNADVCEPLPLHCRLNICKVKVNHTGHIDQIRDSLYRLLQDLIRLLQCVRHRSPSIHDLQQLIVRNDNHGVYIPTQILNTDQGILHPRMCFKTKRLCHNSDRKNPHVLRNPRNNRGCSRTGTATHTTGHKDHVRIFECRFDILCTLFCSFLSYFRFCARTKTLGQLLPYLQKSRSLAALQVHLIRIDSDKFDPGDVLIHHAVHCVISGATHPDNYDLGPGFRFI